MEINAIIFDLGGTLIEYAGEYDRWPDLETPGLTAAYDYLAQQQVRLPEFDKFKAAGFARLPERWRQATSGEQNLRLVDFLDDLLSLCRAEWVAESQVIEAAERYQAAVQKQATLITAAQETVAQVKADGYKVGLLSNTMFTGAAHQADLRRFGLIDYFDALLFSADAGKWKPDAAPFLHVAERLGVAPETAVYIGDDPASDVVGGRRAGMWTIHFRSSQRFANPAEIQAHAEIEDLAALLPLLSAWVGK